MLLLFCAFFLSQIIAVGVALMIVTAFLMLRPHHYGSITAFSKVVTITAQDIDQSSRSAAQSMAGKDILSGSATVKVFYLKVPKTGGTTFRNILLRGALLKGQRLPFLSNQNQGIEMTNLLPMDSIIHAVKHPLASDQPGTVKSLLSGSFRAKHFSKEIISENDCDLISSHGHLNEEMTQKLMTGRVMYITTLRHPTARLDSAKDFFGMYKKLNLEKYPDRLNRYLRQHSNRSLNSITNYFGYEDYKKHKFSYKKIKESDMFLDFLQHINKTFDVIFTEYFDESLLLMRKKYGWSITDLLYTRIHNSKGKSGPTEEDIQLHQNRAKRDFQLYHMFLERHKKLVDQAGPSLQEDLKTFRALRKEHDKLCKRVCEAVQTEAGKNITNQGSKRAFLKKLKQRRTRFSARREASDLTLTSSDCLLESMNVKTLYYMIQFKNRPQLCDKEVFPLIKSFLTKRDRPFLKDFCTPSDSFLYNYPYTASLYDFTGCYDLEDHPSFKVRTSVEPQ